MVMTIIEWLNQETRNSTLVLIGQVQNNAYADPENGTIRVPLLVGQVYNGPRVGPRLVVYVKPGWRGGRLTLGTPFMRDQWVLFFLRSEHGHWVAPPVGRVVETPYKGLTFYPAYNVVLADASPGLSWNFVLDSLGQLVATRKQIINGFMPQLRAARTKEQRDRLNWAIEYQVKEQLGLPVP